MNVSGMMSTSSYVHMVLEAKFKERNVLICWFFLSCIINSMCREVKVVLTHKSTLPKYNFIGE